ncbi:FxsA family protein [Virgisporangium aurantiacum]|uniref:Uncharacterized protein n=1 Tax=Virgisporangium aurantiacum TaxID=175570 RepID=A0A8J3Z338_9ACTN|nr:FxsA family protein [Virgisporangium aurantiacum]GIJ56596.1 hypothetical protein Vau01_041120 [Virgisporangium aurantiacum]
MLRRWLATLGILAVVGVLLELVVLGLVVWQLGAAWTIGLLIVKYAVGYVLVRRTGRRGWRQFRAAVDSGRPPGREGTDAAVSFGAAMLVLLAGFVGAVAGLVLLIPPVRRASARLAERVVERQLTAVAASGMFGPRRVNVQRDPVPEPTASASASEPPPDDGKPQAALEGEILPPR